MAAPLLVVDTPSMLYRAFFALPKKITGKIGGVEGRSVNALLGTANLVLREIAEHSPRAVVLCFGAEAADYRVELFSGYHADRPEMPEELVPQWEDAPELFDAFGWEIARHDTLEADDLLGSYATAEAEAGGTTLLMTGDRDMYQCADGATSVLYVSTGKGAELVGPAEVEQRYGVSPAQVADFIALRGDPSDGLPGAKGVGEKTAADLLAEHGTLEDLLDAAIRISKPKLRTTLLDSADELRAFKQIATLREVEVDPPGDRQTDFAAAAEAAESREINRLAERLRKLAG